MFCWTDDMISFMQDAANFGSYQQELADWICGALPAVRHVCDAGCGLGFLSVRLAERFETVTAADISGQALANLHRMAAEKNVSNLEILETDMMTFTPEAPYDAMVFCLFGGCGKFCAWQSAAARGKSWWSKRRSRTIVFRSPPYRCETM